MKKQIQIGENPLNRRDEFLLEMYRQLWNSINRHIILGWQSAGVLVTVFATLSLVEKAVISLDIAITIIILASAWHFLQVIDSSEWYKRNLHIITNIERQFLQASDEQDIHYYFKENNRGDKILDHLKIQLFLGIGLGCIVLVYHFSARVWGGIGAPLNRIEIQRALPYLVTVFAAIYCYLYKKRRDKTYIKLVTQSPGVKI